MPIVTGKPEAPGPGPQPGGGLNLPVSPPVRTPIPSPTVPTAGVSAPRPDVSIDQTMGAGREAGAALERLGSKIEEDRRRKEAIQVAQQERALINLNKEVALRHSKMAAAGAAIDAQNIAMAQQGEPLNEQAARARIVEAMADYYPSARFQKETYLESLIRSGADINHPTVKRNVAEWNEAIARGEEAQGEQARVDVARKAAVGVVVPYEEEEAISIAGRRRGFDPIGKWDYDGVLPQVNTVLISAMKGLREATSKYEQQQVLRDLHLAINTDVGDVERMKTMSTTRLEALGAPDSPRAANRIKVGLAESLVERPWLVNPDAAEDIMKLGRPGSTERERTEFRKSVEAFAGRRAVSRSPADLMTDAQELYENGLWKALEVTNASRDEATEMIAGAIYMLPQHNRPGSAFSGYDRSRRVFSPGQSTGLQDLSNSFALSTEENMEELEGWLNDAGKGVLRAIPGIATGVARYAARPMQDKEARVVMLKEGFEYLSRGVFDPQLERERLEATGALQAMGRLEGSEVEAELATLEGFEGPPSPGGEEVLPSMFRKTGENDVRTFEEIKRLVGSRVGRPPPMTPRDFGLYPPSPEQPAGEPMRMPPKEELPPAKEWPELFEGEGG